MGLKEKLYVEKISANDEYVLILSEYFHDGDHVKKGDALLEYETSKTILQLCANEDGFIKYQFKEMENVSVGSVLVELYENSEDINKDKIPVVYHEEEKNNVAYFSKAAIYLIEKHSIDPNKFANFDLVTKHDVLKTIDTDSDNSKEIHTGEIQGSNGVWKSVPKLKLVENMRLQENQALASSVSIYVDLTQDQLQSKMQNHILTIILQALPNILLDFPEMNAYYQDQKIFYYNEPLIGLAVDIDDAGMRVVNLKNMRDFTKEQVQIKLMRTLYKVRSNKLTIDDLQGYNFIVSDLSNEGVAFFQPLIGYKQSSILGISGIDAKLNRFVLTLVFDHRITEGKKASQFLYRIKSKIEKDL